MKRHDNEKQIQCNHCDKSLTQQSIQFAAWKPQHGNSEWKHTRNLPVSWRLFLRQMSPSLFIFYWPCISVWFLIYDQLDAQFFSVFISILYMFRATSCSSSGESIVSIQHLVYVTLRRWPCGMQVRKDRHTKQSPTHSDTYQMLYWYNWFSWWWALGCSDCSPLSTGALHGRSQRVTIPDAVEIQFWPPEDENNIARNMSRYLM
jgi:hypothetical protein